MKESNHLLTIIWLELQIALGIAVHLLFIQDRLLPLTVSTYISHALRNLLT